MGVAPFPGIRRFAGLYSRAPSCARGLAGPAACFGRCRGGRAGPLGAVAAGGAWRGHRDLFRAAVRAFAVGGTWRIGHRNSGRGSPRQTSTQCLRASLALLAALLIGFGVAKLRTEAVAAPVLMHKTGPAGIDGRVEFAQSHGKGTRAILTLAHVDHLSTEQMPQRARISVRSGGEALVPGAMGASEGRADAAARAGRARRLRFRTRRLLPAIGRGWICLWQAERDCAAARLHIRRTHRHGGRACCAGKCRRVSKPSCPAAPAAIASALITGDRGGIADDDEQALRDSGLAHVLAIAGLHMALVGLGIVLGGARVAGAVSRYRAQLSDQEMGGGGRALQRRLLSCHQRRECRLDARLHHAGDDADRHLCSTGRRFRCARWRSRRRSFCCMQPESLLEPGFQMSFAAVVSLIAVAEWERARPRDYGRATFSQCAALSARHRHDEFHRQHRHHALCRLSFRPRHALRGARQSAAPCR